MAVSSRSGRRTAAFELAHKLVDMWIQNKGKRFPPYRQPDPAWADKREAWIKIRNESISLVMDESQPLVLEHGGLKKAAKTLGLGRNQSRARQVILEIFPF